MTCIVGMIDKDNTVYIGGDGLASFGSSTVPLKNPKVFQRGNLVVGTAGAARSSQVLHYNLKIPELDRELYAYICGPLIDAIRECLKDKDCLEYKDGREKAAGGSLFLMGYGPCLFLVDNNFGIHFPARDYEAIGSGEEFALGSLFSTGELEPLERISKALKAASKYCSSVGPPFTIRKIPELSGEEGRVLKELGL